MIRPSTPKETHTKAYPNKITVLFSACANYRAEHLSQSMGQHLITHCPRSFDNQYPNACSMRLWKKCVRKQIRLLFCVYRKLPRRRSFDKALDRPFLAVQPRIFLPPLVHRTPKVNAFNFPCPFSFLSIFPPPHSSFFLTRTRTRTRTLSHEHPFIALAGDRHWNQSWSDARRSDFSAM